MVLKKVLVALRKIGDLSQVTSFLHEIGEHPYLIVAILKFNVDVEQYVVKFENPPADVPSEMMHGFEFELVKLEYRLDKLPSSVFTEEAVKGRCETIIVVSDGRKPLFNVDLASTLASESSVPVLVVHR